jgi:hypothetical protein
VLKAEARPYRRPNDGRHVKQAHRRVRREPADDGAG